MSVSDSVKKLVVYYSLDGNTRFIARAIADSVGADVLELKVDAEPPKNSFMKYFWGGRQVMTKQIPSLIPFSQHPEDYDMLFIGTPVWAFSYAPALAAFFSRFSLKGKKVALFCCSGGMKGKTFERMKEKLFGNTFLGEKHFIEPLRRREEQAALEARTWAAEMALSRGGFAQHV
jgi:flavodoxin